jgi:hypothetical protein
MLSHKETTLTPETLFLYIIAPKDDAEEFELLEGASATDSSKLLKKLSVIAKDYSEKHTKIMYTYP